MSTIQTIRGRDARKMDRVHGSSSAREGVSDMVAKSVYGNVVLTIKADAHRLDKAIARVQHTIARLSWLVWARGYRRCQRPFVKFGLSRYDTEQAAISTARESGRHANGQRSSLGFRYMERIGIVYGIHRFRLVLL